VNYINARQQQKLSRIVVIYAPATTSQLSPTQAPCPPDGTCLVALQDATEGPDAFECSREDNLPPWTPSRCISAGAASPLRTTRPGSGGRACWNEEQTLMNWERRSDKAMLSIRNEVPSELAPSNDRDAFVKREPKTGVVVVYWSEAYSDTTKMCLKIVESRSWKRAVFGNHRYQRTTSRGVCSETWQTGKNYPFTRSSCRLRWRTAGSIRNTIQKSSTYHRAAMRCADWASVWQPQKFSVWARTE